MKIQKIILTVAALSWVAIINCHADGTNTNSTVASSPNSGIPTNFPPWLSRYIDIEAGSIILQPFNVDSSGNVTASSATARAEVSGIFQTREASRDTNSLIGMKAVSFLGKGTNWEWLDLIEPKDFELQLGYAFAGSSSSGGSAAAGSGDAFGETSLGANWFTIVQETNNPFSPIYTIGPEIFGGFNSDSTYHRLHYDYGAGVAFVAGIPIDTANPDRPKLELMSRVGYARVDSMTYGDTTDTVLMDGSIPRFGEKSALQINAEARLPIIKPGSLGEFGYLSVGGAFYKLYDRGPDTWTMYVAISIPLSNLLKAIPALSLP